VRGVPREGRGESATGGVEREVEGKTEEGGELQGGTEGVEDPLRLFGVLEDPDEVCGCHDEMSGVEVGKVGERKNGRRR
jgi:hypothetical protein